MQKKLQKIECLTYLCSEIKKSSKVMDNNNKQMQTSKRNIHFITTLPIHPLFINEDAPKNAPQNEPQKLIAQSKPR